MLGKITDICSRFVYNYMISTKDENLTDKSNQMKCLSEVFASYGGILAKISQMLCMEDGHGYMYSECTPYSRDKTINYLKTIFETNKDGFFDNISNIDFEVYKSGSIGQVHKAVFTDNNNMNNIDIAIKVQYVGLREQFDTDINILKMVSKFLYNFIDVNTERQVISKLYEEIDYNIEFNNQTLIYDIWKDTSDIIIPKLIPSLCNDIMITSEFIDAEDMFSFVKNSTQDQRNNIGLLIINFLYTTMFQYKIFYSDIHYGNFLIKDKTKLVVVDFGCLNKLEDSLCKNLISIHTSVLNNDTELFFKTVSDMGILNDENIKLESRKHMWDYFKQQLEPYVSENFVFTKEWLTKYTYKDTKLMDDWILPSNCVYFNKLNYGMSHLLTELNLQGNILELFTQTITEKMN